MLVESEMLMWRLGSIGYHDGVVARGRIALPRSLVPAGSEALASQVRATLCDDFERKLGYAVKSVSVSPAASDAWWSQWFVVVETDDADHFIVRCRVGLLRSARYAARRAVGAPDAENVMRGRTA